jgi:hypothetical protein
MRRGRPPKFGRTAELVALTLPRDVVQWLRSLNQDPAWAIVSLFERSAKRGRSRDVPRGETELVSVGRRRWLIVVNPKSINTLPGVSLIPLSSGRSFLALEPGKSTADLEVAVVDQLEERGLAKGKRNVLTELRRQLRGWRQDRSVSFRTRSIIVVERRGTRQPKSAIGNGRS